MNAKPWSGCSESFSHTATAFGRTSEPTKSLKSTVRFQNSKELGYQKDGLKIPTAYRRYQKTYRRYQKAYRMDTKSRIRVLVYQPRTKNQEPRTILSPLAPLSGGRVEKKKR